MTEAQAKYLASLDEDYTARCIRGRWLVWSKTADHMVEFDTPEADGYVGGEHPQG